MNSKKISINNQEDNDNLLDGESIGGLFGNSTAQEEIIRKLKKTRKNLKKHPLSNISKKWKVLIAVAIIGAILYGFWSLASIYTNILWYKQLGYLQVPLTKYGTMITLFLIGFIIAFFCSFISMKHAFSENRARGVAGNTKNASLLTKTLTMFEPARKIFNVVIPAIIGFFIAMACLYQWSSALTFFNAKSFNSTDAVFGLDISFFVFKLPFIQAILAIAESLITVLLIISVLMGFVYGGIRLSRKKRPRLRISPSLWSQLAVVLGIWCIISGSNLWFLRYSMLYSKNPSFDGATSAIVHTTIPALTIMAIIWALIALVFFASILFTNKLRASTKNIVKKPRKLALVLGVFGLILSVILTGVAPQLVQNFIINPSAQSKESSYIKRNIDATISAYDVQNIEKSNYSGKSKANAEQIKKEVEKNSQIRLLDPAVVSPTFRQLQQNKQYYDFPQTLSVDNYSINGNSTDAILGVRDIKTSGIAKANSSWVNLHTVYTHGYGIVAAYGSKVDENGQPIFIEKDIPSSGKLGTYEPRIYFGQNSPNYSIVGSQDGSKSWELDYPTDKNAKGQANTSYKGNGGPNISSLFNRLAFAIRFRDSNILFTDRINKNSQILFNRTPQQRVSSVAPYLTLDERTYPAVVNGRIVWIVDGYTTTDNYPYSQHTNLKSASLDSLTTASNKTGISALPNKQVNYIRNSVKAVVDAYSGEVTLYAWNENDPILQTWSSIYKNTLKPVSSISGELMSHLRYPESLFKVQRNIVSNYHVTDPESFYSGQGFWSIPNDPTQGKGTYNQPAYYQFVNVNSTAKDANATKPVFSLTTSFIPIGSGNNTRNILTGYMVVNSEAGNKAGVISKDYGKFSLLQLPQSATVAGPGQVQNLFNSSPVAQSAIRLLKDGGSQVLYGNLLTIPISGGLLYVEPVFVQSSTGTQFPTLRKVLVSFNGKVGFANTLDQALNQVLK